jgi:hypothetical protein
VLRCGLYRIIVGPAAAWLWDLGNVWDALSSYEKAAIRKLALGFEWGIPEIVRRRLRSLGLIESGPDGRLTDAGWKLLRANPRRKPGAKPRRSLITNGGKPV